MKYTLSLFCLFLISTFSQLVGKEKYYSSWGSAIKGYDPVAYFEESKPIKGNKNFTMKWKGVSWRFSSQKNLDSFKATPEKFAPQYGGYCAWAVSQNYTAKIDPNAWHIDNGKLYLNYNKDIAEKWLKDKSNLISKANDNWPAISKELK